MKNRKNVYLCLLAGLISCSYCMTASAGSRVDGKKLKSGLLGMERGNAQYNILDYNTNDDNIVNVLDLCRVKSDFLEAKKPESQNIEISCAGPWISDDKSEITIPVQIKGNTLGVSVVSFDVVSDNWYFELSNVYSSSNAEVSFSKSDHVQYVAPDGYNLTTEGYFVYLVFKTSPSVPSAVYNIELDDIQAAMIGSDGKAYEIPPEECTKDTEISFEFSREEPKPVTTVTEEVTTVTTTVTLPPETTTVTTTTTPKAVEPPKNDELSFGLDNAVLSGDSRQLKIPVYMNGNTSGVCNFTATVKYDRNKFTLNGVERGEFEGYGYVSGNMDNAVFNTNNNVNITAQSGVIAYLNFEVKGGADQNSYRFELSEIKASKSENWNQKNIDKCRKNSEAYEFKFGGNVPAVTTVKPEETTVTTVTTSKPAETTIVTTVTEPPVVITTTVTEPPVQPTSQPEEDADLEQVEKDVIDLVNNYKQNQGLPKLKISAALCRAAEQRAQELSVSFGSARPNGQSLDELFRENGLSIRSNHHSYHSYTKTAATATEVYNDIIKYKSKNFDNSVYKIIGVGHYPTSSKDYWVLFFGG